MSATDRILEKCIGDEPPFCQAALPLHLDVRGYVGLMRQGKCDEALALIREKLPFPGTIGRICNHPCEDECLRGKKVDEALAICALKRFVADYEVGRLEMPLPEIGPDTGKKVAVIGGGPSGMVCAIELRKAGHGVTIFEAREKLGGMLYWGIPDYRLPKDVLERETSIVERLGVKVKYNTCVGMDVSLADIRKGFDALYIGCGAQGGRKIGLDNEEAPGVMTGIEFLRLSNMKKPMDVRGKILVVGGGNVAVDAALTARRLGAAEVDMVCLEKREEMPASKWEIEQSIEEGIRIDPSWGPCRIEVENGRVRAVEFRRCTAVFDEEGRFSPAFDDDVRTTYGADMVVLAVGQSTETEFVRELPEVKLLGGGWIKADPLSLATGLAGVFAGGDLVTGPKMAIDAVSQGREAAESIRRYLAGRDLLEGRRARETALVVEVAEGIERRPRAVVPSIPVNGRKGFEEVELAFDKAIAMAEGDRCLECQCRQCAKECEFLKREGVTPHELAARFKAGYYGEGHRTPYLCSVCDLCKSVCPQELSVGEMCMEMREAMVASGLGPMPGHKLVRKDQEWSTSDAVVLAQPDPHTGRCDRVFFPGCNLSGYSPELVARVLAYLQEKLPNTGVVLGCCGGPTYLLGDRPGFSKILADFITRVEKLGASELILGCPDCYHTVKHHAPGVRIRALPEVIREQGGPAGVASQAGSVFSVHDSCKARGERGWQESVRTLLSSAGHRIEEMALSRDMTRCCGHGGMVSYVDFELEGALTEKRAEEASHTILTYCAACRDALALHKPAIHLLEVLFNPEWEKALQTPPKTGKARRENQARLKAILEK